MFRKRNSKRNFQRVELNGVYFGKETTHEVSEGGSLTRYIVEKKQQTNNRKII
ncbi:DUF4855 domain-containing protein [Prevotella melaninogenica]|nr:DUF4855 domain-containing protein [Prevotella melaninogenica]